MLTKSLQKTGKCFKKPMFTLPGKLTAQWSRAGQSGGTQGMAGTTLCCGSMALAKGVLHNNKKRQSGNVCFPQELFSAPDCFFKACIQSWQQHLPIISPFSVCKGMHFPLRCYLLYASPGRKYMQF